MPSFTTSLVPDPVSYRALTPPELTDGLPLVVLLHGAFSGEEALARREPAWTEAWEQGWFPPAVVVCASTPTRGGFYTGPWERVVADALPIHAAATFGVDLDRVVLLGGSMGGYGALKLAFRHPDRYLAVAALMPALFPGETPEDVTVRNAHGVLGELLEAIRGSYDTENVVQVLRRNADAVRDSGLAIALECGDDDAFRLQDGTEHLHRVLWELDLSHDYRLVRGADHLGRGVARRERTMMRFLADALGGEEPDPEVLALRAEVAPPPGRRYLRARTFLV